jgi:hypothetical protein
MLLLAAQSSGDELLGLVGLLAFMGFVLYRAHVRTRDKQQERELRKLQAEKLKLELGRK